MTNIKPVVKGIWFIICVVILILLINTSHFYGASVLLVIGFLGYYVIDYIYKKTKKSRD